MTNEKTEEISTVQNMTKQEMTKIIKTAKREAESLEKEFFDELGMNATAIQAFDTYWKSITNMVLSQIDTSANFAKIYVQFRFDMINSYGEVAHLLMDNYARAWNQINSHNRK
jgi:hypothetical protein